jgi:hypothetical protein
MISNPSAQTNRPPGIGDDGGWVNGVFYKLLFYRDKDGNERGPIDEGLLEALKLSGHLDGASLVRVKNSSEWKRMDGKAGQVKSSTSKPAPTTSKSVPPTKTAGQSKNPALTVLGIIVGFFVLICIIAGLSNNNSSGTNQNYTSSTAGTYPPAATPVPTPFPTPETTPPPESTPSPTPYSLPYTPPSNSGSYSRNDGATYSVPHYTSQSHNFAARKANIDREGIELDSEKVQLKSLSDEIERIRPYLNNNSQDSVDRFNAKVDTYNNLNSQLKQKFNAFNREVDQYNLELEQVGRKY